MMISSPCNVEINWWLLLQPSNIFLILLRKEQDGGDSVLSESSVSKGLSLPADKGKELSFPWCESQCKVLSYQNKVKCKSLSITFQFPLDKDYKRTETNKYFFIFLYLS